MSINNGQMRRSTSGMNLHRASTVEFSWKRSLITERKEKEKRRTSILLSLFDVQLDFLSDGLSEFFGN